ncbi:hypothetical protein U9M48_010139 [Paspalum notatum var. saurae]|uniref:Uncharacterized protein n=1 Tax=Paspalum notatum var. saurae TaxID=547442 RepID=A0AAQ3WG94_PASNO
MSIDHFAPVFVSRERRANAEQPPIEEPEDPQPYPQQEDLRRPPTPLPTTPTLARKVGRPYILLANYDL